MSNETTSDSKSANPIVRYFQDFKVLRRTRAEYWGIQVINFLDSTTFFSILTIAVVMLSEDFGFSDENAGYAVTLYAATTTICLFLSGTVTDWLGIRRSFYLAMAGQGITRAAVVIAALRPDLPHREVIVVVAFFLMAPFVAMVQTVFQAANKRFTTKTSRGAGFNLWYLFMNIGAASAGFLIDIVRKALDLPNAHIFTFAVGAAVVCTIATAIFVRREEQIYDPDEEPAAPAEPSERKKNPLQIAGAVLAEPVFWRFLCLASLLVGVRAVFLYMHILWPKYWLRVIGPDALIGTLTTINPILVIIGLILLIPVLHRFNVYNMLVYGAMVSAMSLFVLAIPSYGQMTYLVSIFALIVLTVGEVVWSPRLQEYTAAIAPAGQEGTYLGLSMVPYFLAKTTVSLLSGHMLSRWVPEGIGEQLRAGTVGFWESPSALWIILGAFAFAGPIVGVVFRGWFTRGAQWQRASAGVT